MFNLNAEVRFPIWRQLGGTIFQDAGALKSTSFADFKPDNLLVCTGLGLRYHTPIGPLRFDIAFKWKSDARSTGMFAWFLTFGNAF
jgi:outer membrane translocation and assembly module TamA